VSGGYYETDSVYKGFVNLTHYDGKIAAGTFQFDCRKGSGKVVHITDGRFDIAYE
jgi:hypothetical protein